MRPRPLLIAKGVKDEHSFRQIDFQDYLRRRASTNTRCDTRPQVAVVVAEGEILGGDQPPGTVGGESTAKLIRSAREDNKVKAAGVAREFAGRRCVRLGTDPPRSRTDARPPANR